MVGRCVSFWEGLFSGAMLVSGRVTGFLGSFYQPKQLFFFWDVWSSKTTPITTTPGRIYTLSLRVLIRPTSLETSGVVGLGPFSTWTFRLTSCRLLPRTPTCHVPWESVETHRKRLPVVGVFLGKPLKIDSLKLKSWWFGRWLFLFQGGPVFSASKPLMSFPGCSVVRFVFFFEKKMCPLFKRWAWGYKYCWRNQSPCQKENTDFRLWGGMMKNDWSSRKLIKMGPPTSCTVVHVEP